MDGTRPIGLSLVLCDNVYTDRYGKRALVGLFNRITALKFPATHRRMVIYASITDIRSNAKLKLDIVHGETDQQVLCLEGAPPEEAEPTTIIDFVFEIENAVFPEAGTYFVRFWGNEYPLLQRPIEVIAAQQQKPKDPDEESKREERNDED